MTKKCAKCNRKIPWWEDSEFDEKDREICKDCYWKLKEKKKGLNGKQKEKVKKCARCGKELTSTWYTEDTGNKNDENFCEDCWNTDEEETEMIQKYGEKGAQNIQKIEKEIERLEKMSDTELILYILGVIGMFFFIIPGIIFFIIAGRISSSRKTHIASLRAQLVMLEQQSKRTEYPKSKRKEDKCPYCKTKLNPDDEFCPKCGRKV